MAEREHPPAGDKLHKRGYGAPFSLHLTPEERKTHDKLAGGQPIAAFIKDALFNREVGPRARGARPVRDKAALARLLGC